MTDFLLIAIIIILLINTQHNEKTIDPIGHRIEKIETLLSNLREDTHFIAEKVTSIEFNTEKSKKENKE